MKKIIAILVATCVMTIFITSSVYAGTSTEQARHRREQEINSAAGTYMVNNNVITPVTFKKVAEYVKKSNPELNFNIPNKDWCASVSGFTKIVKVEEGFLATYFIHVELKWDGGIYLVNSGKETYLGDWTTLK